MSLIMRFLGSTPTPGRNAWDERWWDGAAQQSVAGVYIDADTALKISTVWACVQLLAETIAALPLSVYRRTAGEERERARNNPLYEVLHDRPNATQTAAEFREMMTGHVLMRGDAYAQIVPGMRGAVDQLIPIHPDRVQVEKLPNGRLRYQVQQDDGQKRPFNQEDIFHLRGPSRDGITGMSVVDYARDSFGMTVAAERYGGRFFRNDSKPGGVLRTPNKLSKEAGERLKARWEAAHTSASQHRVAVLEEGLEWQQVGISPDEAQFLETREFQAEDVCRWFRVPPHMVGLTSKATSWGSGIEQMSMGFVTYTLMPWLTRWTETISRDLIIAPQTYFAEFQLAGLLRGDVASRYSAYAIARQWGWLNVNEIRQFENMNGIGPEGDVYLQPMNMEEAGAPAGAPDGAEAVSAPVDVFARKQLRLLAEEAAGRVVRKEIAAINRAADRANGDMTQFYTAVFDFYHDHVSHVAQTMRISEAAALAYCNEGRHEIIQEGASMGDWQPRRVHQLADLAVNG